MVAFGGRMEALIKVPAGGAAYSASIGASPAAYAGTIPAANYFLTPAGGVLSLPAVLQQQLNDNVQGYPQTAAAMQAAVGYGTWSASWLCNESSGNLIAAFGGVNMTPVSTPLYGLTGPRSGIDKAVGFDSAADGFAGGNNYNVTLADDLCFAWVGKFTATPGANGGMFDKRPALGWKIEASASGPYFNVNDGADRNAALSAAANFAGEPHVGMVVLDRAANAMRICMQSLTSGVQVISSAVSAAGLGTLGNVGNFQFGTSVWAAAASTFQISAAYVGAGAGVAASMSANLAAAVANFANAINDSWTIALSTTDGRITASGSFWPRSIAFTATAQRDVLGYAYDFDYPQTAAQMATALGYGNWTAGAGYLCNELAGNPASIFGTPASLTATSLTYSNLGARGGNDKAIGFDATADNADGADNFEVTTSDDLIVVEVLRVATDPTAGAGTNFVSKVTAGRVGWQIYDDAAGHVSIVGSPDGASFQFASVATTYDLNSHLIVIGVMDRSTSKMRVGTYNLTTGAVAVSAEANCTLNYNTAGTFRIGADAYLSGAANSFVSALYVVSGPGVAAGLSANLSTALSNFATYMKSQTGTQQARGLWIPGDLISMDGDPRRAPTMSDARRTMSPIGQVLTLVGNTYRKHTNVVYPYVTIDRVWDAEATYENGSWEEFVLETQLGQGSTWFTPGSAIQIYDHNNVQVGVDANVAGWYMVGVDDVNPRKSEGVGEYTGLWRIEIPMLIAVGS